MRTIVCSLALAAVAGFFLLSGGVQAGEEKVPLDKLPKAVVTAVKKRFPKAELVEAVKETVDKKTEYEVILKNGGYKIDVTLTPEGTILQMEKEISAKELPKAVVTTLKKNYPNAAYKKIEEFIRVKDGKESLEFYEALLETADKKTVEVKVEASGKILSPDAKDSEKKEEKKEGGKQAGDRRFDSLAETTALVSTDYSSRFVVKPENENTARLLPT